MTVIEMIFIIHEDARTKAWLCSCGWEAVVFIFSSACLWFHLNCLIFTSMVHLFIFLCSPSPSVLSIFCLQIFDVVLIPFFFFYIKLWVRSVQHVICPVRIITTQFKDKASLIFFSLPAFFFFFFFSSCCKYTGNVFWCLHQNLLKRRDLILSNLCQ